MVDDREFDNSSEFIDNGWNDGLTHVGALRELVGDSRGVIKIATGFVSPKGLVALAEATEGREVLLLIGDLRTLQGHKHSLDELRTALAWVRRQNVRVKLRFSKNREYSWRLHAKVWVFHNSAVITSANITGGGLGLAPEVGQRQPELGVIARSPNRVKWLDEWFDEIWGGYYKESTKLERLLNKELAKFGNTPHVPSSNGDRRPRHSPSAAGVGSRSQGSSEDPFNSAKDGCFPMLVVAGLIPVAVSVALYLKRWARHIFGSQK